MFSKVVRETVEKSTSKSCPSYPILTRTCLDELLSAITSLVKSWLWPGIFPIGARLLPKIKNVSLDKEDLNSFRRITNLAFESNVIERMRACQVHHYLVSNNLYPKLQPAYQQSHGTETVLLRVHIDIIQGHRQHLTVSTMAFLLHWIQTQFGFTDTVPQWFESYIRNRFQKVVIGCTESHRSLY